MRCSIYGLYSTEDGEIRYIGQTRISLETRLAQHLGDAGRKNERKLKSHCYRWIRKTLRNGHRIGIQLLEADAEYEVAERQWIAIFRQRFPGRLTNISDGGEGYTGQRSLAWRIAKRRPRSEETKAKMRKPKSLQMRQRLSASLRGNSRGRGERNGEAKLTEAQVLEIRSRMRGGESLSSLAAAYGVSKAAMSKIRCGRTWKHLRDQDAHLYEDNGRYGQRSDGDPRGDPRQATG